MKIKVYIVALLMAILIILTPIAQSLTFHQETNSVTQNIMNVPYYYVDNNLSDVDSSGDKGTHSNFTAQQSSPDSTFDNLTEENTGEDQRIEDYVDNDSSDVDDSADVGFHSDFSAQQASPDSIFDTLTEDNIYDIQEVSIQASWSADISTSTKYPNDGGDFVGDGGYGKLRTAIKFPLDQLPSNAIITGVNFTIYCYEGGTATHQVDVHPYNNDGQADPQVDSASAAYSRCAPTGVPYIDNSPDLRTVGLKEFVLSSAAYIDIENAKAFVNKFSIGLHEEGDNDWYACLVEYTEPNTDWRPTLHISYYTSSSYELDLEVQFTDVINYFTSETLCIYAGTLGAEDLHLDFWNGTGWQNIATDLVENDWNNFTVSLTSFIFTIRFAGSITSSDSIQDIWEIDAVLLVLSGAAYEDFFVDNENSNVDLSDDIGSIVDFSNMTFFDNYLANLTEAGGGDYDSTIMSFSPDYRWELDGDETDSVDAANSDGGNDPSWVSNIIPNGATQCGDYNGVSDKTLIPNQADINSGTTYRKSISVWVEIDTIDTSGNGRVIWGEGGGTNGLAIYVLNVGGEDRLYACVYESTSIDYCYTTISAGTLYQIGLTLDCTANELILYVNGVQVASDVSLAIGSSFSGHSAGVAIGGVDSNMNNHNDVTLNGYFDGRIADVVYYAEQTVLTEEDFASIYSVGVGGGDYRLDQEIQFVNVPYSLPNEELSIYGGSMGDEDILLDVWNGTDWETIFTDLSSGWNNASITNRLTNSTFTIRFKDGTEVGDASQDTWQIDVALIHVWDEGKNYELDLEVQWTNVDYSEANEELCIYGGLMGSENILVDVWDGESWVNLFTDLTNGWNNVTVSSYLTSSVLTIRFKGAYETNDSTQDSWEIDATLLHVWS